MITMATAWIGATLLLINVGFGSTEPAAMALDDDNGKPASKYVFP